MEVDQATRERTAKALFDYEVERAGREIKWDADWPSEPTRSEWLRIADIAISAMLGGDQ